MSVVWHDLECGGYTEDLPLWRELADRHGGPILDVGAGTGRVTLDLARRGHAVTALDSDPTLLDELARRAAGLPVATVAADARDFTLAERFALCLVPMQTLQLLDGRSGRRAFLACARRHLRPGGVLAVAIVERIEAFEVTEGQAGPLADVLERDGSVYFSSPTAVRAGRDGFVLERRRERVAEGGEHIVEQDVVRLDALTCEALEDEARAMGLRARGRLTVASTADHVGSAVVILGG